MRIIVITLLIFALSVLPVYAHPGSLDGDGGHYNRSTGEYHYHHGKPAHQHENGVCPYDYEDTTDTSYTPGANNDNTTYTPRTPYTPRVNKDDTAPARTVVEEEKPTPPKSDGALFLIALAAFLVFRAIVNLCGKIKSKLDFKSKQKEYVLLYGDKAINELADIPRGTEIGADHLPKQANTIGWGKMYTAYISKTGTVFHRRGCNKHASLAVHICNVPKNFTPCKKCKPEKPPLDWYYEYEKILSIKEQYKIP